MVSTTTDTTISKRRAAEAERAHDTAAEEMPTG